MLQDVSRERDSRLARDRCCPCRSTPGNWSRRWRPPPGTAGAQTAGCAPGCTIDGRAGCVICRRRSAVTLVWVKRIWRCLEPRCAADLDRDHGGDPTADRLDRAGAAGGVPPSRRAGADGGRGGGGVRGRLGDGHGRRPRLRPAALWTTPPGWLECTRSAWTRPRSWPRRQPPARHSPLASSRSTVARGCSTSSKDEAEPPCRTGFLAATRPGGTESGWPHWAPSAGTPPRCGSACRRPPGCSMRSMWCASASTRSTRSPSGPAGDPRPPRTRRRPAVPDPPAAPPRARAPARGPGRLPAGLAAGDHDSWSAGLDRRPRTAAALPLPRPGPGRTASAALVCRRRRARDP